MKFNKPTHFAKSCFNETNVQGFEIFNEETLRQQKQK